MPARMARCERRLRSLADPHSSTLMEFAPQEDWIQAAIVVHRIVKWTLFGLIGLPFSPANATQ